MQTYTSTTRIYRDIHQLQEYTDTYINYKNMQTYASSTRIYRHVNYKNIQTGTPRQQSLQYSVDSSKYSSNFNPLEE
jgi:hypothetical protein